jgi:hypothetical protein
VHAGTAPAVGGGTGTSAGRVATPAASAEPDGASELTRLMLPVAGDPGPDDAVAGDPLSGIDSVLGDPFAGSAAQPQWDVGADELGDPFPSDVLAEHTAAPAAPIHDDVTPSLASGPLFADDDAAAEFELTELAPSPAAPPPAAAAAKPAAPLAELSGAMRDQVHATIEKIAWEALGDVSERIVREAVARIEQVAWDVIPRLAETLIREEIRKLKGEE